MFPADRYERAGATPEQVAAAEAAYDAMTVAAQQTFEDQVRSVSDGDLRQQLAAAAMLVPLPVDNPPKGGKPSRPVVISPEELSDEE